MKKFLGIALIIICCLLLVPLAMTSCNGLSEETLGQIQTQSALLKEQVNQIQQNVVVAQEQIKVVQETLAALPPDSDFEQRKALEDLSAKAQAYIEKAIPWLDASKKTLEAASKIQTEDDLVEAINQGARDVSPLVPPPWGAFLTLGVTTIIGFWRAIRNRSIARTLVTAADKVKVYDNLTEVQKAALSKAQGETVKAFVDETQGKSTPLPI